VWVPFGSILAEILPSEKGTDNRFAKRIFSFLIIITLTRAYLRSTLVYGSERLVIADIEEDLHEVLHITQNLSGIAPYKLKIYKEVFVELYNTKKSPDKSKDGTKEETIISVTSRELCDYYKDKTGKAITTNNLKQNYLNEFLNNGLIDEADSILDKRQKIYHPLIDFPPADDESEPAEKIKKLSISDRMDNILQHPNLLFHKNCRIIPENWLELEIFELLKCPFKLDKFELYNKNNERICICNFIKNYEKNVKLNGYFSRPIFSNYHSKRFGDMTYIRKFNAEECKKISITSQMDDFHISDHAIDIKSGLKGENNKTNPDNCVSQIEISPIVSIDAFFYDTPDLPYTPLPKHSLEHSPCYPIILQNSRLYYCNIHPDIESVHLESIEHHCKYKEPDVHKSEILRLLSTERFATGEQGRV